MTNNEGKTEGNVKKFPGNREARRAAARAAAKAARKNGEAPAGPLAMAVDDMTLKDAVNILAHCAAPLQLDLKQGKARQRALDFCAKHFGEPEFPFLPKKAAANVG